MPIDPVAARAYEFEPLLVEVERTPLRFFAQAIGESRPEYVDVEAARAAGFRDLPVPPTYYFSLELHRADPFGFLTALEIDLRGVLHGEQSFEYHGQACAGDTLTLTTHVTDVVSKRGGAMELLTKSTDVHEASQGLVARLTSVLVVRSVP